MSPVNSDSVVFGADAGGRAKGDAEETVVSASVISVISIAPDDFNLAGVNV